MSSVHWYGFLTLVALLSLSATEEPYSISHISPKSVSIKVKKDDSYLETSEDLSFQSVQSSVKPDSITTPEMHSSESNTISYDHSSHIRVERSASPILNEISSKPSLNEHNKQLEHLDNNDVESSGRYFKLIHPTVVTKIGDEFGVMTTSRRMGKDLDNADNVQEDSFLVKGGPRSITSGSPIMPTSATPLFQIAPTLNINAPRQNPNPDIQDIITGIVKLLNGNVNVHANTQSSRRPISTRINNRGPPRISEAQPISDYEFPLTSTMRPPPYPFDRPEGPVRPFLTGVPIPEQIVPSMQQNYRPGFISQNRPPWQRPRPRPPITGNRRPIIPVYKPMQPMPDYHPADEYPPSTTTEAEVNVPASDGDSTETNLDVNTYEVEEETNDDKNSLEKEITSEIPMKKDELSKKKVDKLKMSEKKPIMPVTHLDISTSSTAIELLSASTGTEFLTTIIESISEVHTEQYIPSTMQTTLATQSTVFEEDGLSTTSNTMLLESSIVEIAPSYSVISSIGTTEFTPNLMESTTSSATITLSNVKETSSSQPIQTSLNQQPTEIKTSIASAHPSNPSFPYHPRPGIVLDDPEFKPGGHGRPQRPRPQQPVQPTKIQQPPGYGEIFDVTLSAIQGPTGGNSGVQTVNIKPYGSYPGPDTGNGDIIISPSGDEGFVSIDGKRTYINLFGEPTEAPASTATTQQEHQSSIKPTQVLPSGVTGTGYAIVETETVKPPPQQQVPHRPLYRPPRPQQPQQPPVRIDTCIVGDDSTCDQAQNERCKTENGVSSCHCRPGYARRKHREPCRRVISLLMSLRVDKIYERRVAWDKQLAEVTSEPYSQLSYEAIRAIDSAMSMTPFSDEFMEAKVNRIYNGDPSKGAAGVFVNLTLQLEENGDTLRPGLKADIQRHLLGVIHRRNNNIGNSALYVESPPGSVSNLQDLDECTSVELNDCHPEASCSNVWGSFRCECPQGLRDPWSDQPQRAGRECQACPETYCNNRGSCSYENGNQVCSCYGSYYGSQCEIDGEVLGVAIGASVAAVIIIILTLICLVMWSKRWHREQKNAIGSPVFGYMAGSQVKTPVMGQTPYQVTLEDRMRWAQIADVMAQANHYAAEPVASTRPSSAMFGYPNLQAMNTIASMGTLGTMSLAGTLPLHSGTLPPVPLPRLGLHSRSNGMRTLENSSSSEEEDRTDLLGRNFQVPRPKSRSNASVTNQSGIYYDVDYEPSGGEMYGTTNGNNSTLNSVPGPQGIPMSTYTAGRTPYYMK